VEKERRRENYCLMYFLLESIVFYFGRFRKKPASTAKMLVNRIFSLALSFFAKA